MTAVDLDAWVPGEDVDTDALVKAELMEARSRLTPQVAPPHGATVTRVGLDESDADWRRQVREEGHHA